MIDNPWFLWALSPLAPILGFFSPATRLFYLYVISGLFIAFIWYWRSGKSVEFAPTLLSRKVWLSQSAVNDYFLLIVNPLFLFPLIFLTQFPFKEMFLKFSAALTYLGVAPLTTEGSSRTLITIALTVFLFIVDDFVRWGTHFLSHKVPTLWEFHKIHHSAEVLNFMTAERFHPVDTFITTVAVVLAAALINGCFIILFGDTLTIASLAGANIITVGFNFAGAVLRHSPFWISYGPMVERWLISPAMHHVHHSSLQDHWDRNFGSFLSLWDRWAGTLYIPQQRESLTFGIGRETSEYRSIISLYILPFKKTFRSAHANRDVLTSTHER